MKRTLIAAAGLALIAACGVASAASWSVVVEPGVYGRVAIGGYVQAPLVYEDAPVVVGNDGYVTEVDDYDQAVQYQEPVYLWVPEYQRTHWNEYCDQYGARGVPVYFVQDGWYRDNVMSRRWTPEQRSWNRDQWIEQDRIARDRWERARWDREHWNRQPDYRQPAQWQGSHGPQWSPQPSWQSQWHGDPQRGAPQPQWHGDPGHAPQQWNGTPVRNEPDRDHGGGAGRSGWNQPRGGNGQPVGAWQPGSSAHGQPVVGTPQPIQGGHGGYQPSQPAQPVQPGYGAQQPGQWAHGGGRPVQPGVGSNQPAQPVWSHQPAPVQPVPTAYNPGQNAGRNTPHDDGGSRGQGGEQERSGGRDAHGAYQHRPNESVDR
jgi:hypothetical protein